MVIFKMLTAPIFLCFIACILATDDFDPDHGNSPSSEGSSSAEASSSASASSSSSVKPKPRKSGACPNITVDPVDFQKLSGSWYEIERSCNNVDNSDKCYHLTWSEPVNNQSTLTYKSTSNIKPITNTMISTVRTNPRGTGFTYRLPTLGSIFKEQLIIDTDYENYAVVWSCEMHGKKRVDYGWGFSRRPTPPCDYDEIVQQAYARYNLEVPKMVKHDLSKCCNAFASYNYCF